jgi:hypothetical protein
VVTQLRGCAGRHSTASPFLGCTKRFVDRGFSSGATVTRHANRGREDLDQSDAIGPDHAIQARDAD